MLLCGTCHPTRVSCIKAILLFVELFECGLYLLWGWYLIYVHVLLWLHALCLTFQFTSICYANKQVIWFVDCIKNVCVWLHCMSSSTATIQAKINIAMTYTAPEGAGGGGGGGGGGGNQDDEDEGEITLGDEAADTGEEPAGETLTGEGGGKTSAATEEAYVD